MAGCSRDETSSLSVGSLADVTSCYPITSFAANGMPMDLLRLQEHHGIAARVGGDEHTRREKSDVWRVWSVALESSEQQYAGCSSEAKAGVDRYELRIHEKSWASIRLIAYRCAVTGMPVPCKEWTDEIVPTPFEPTSEDADGVASPASTHAGNGMRNEQ